MGGPPFRLSARPTVRLPARVGLVESTSLCQWHAYATEAFEREE